MAEYFIHYCTFVLIYITGTSWGSEDKTITDAIKFEPPPKSIHTSMAHSHRTGHYPQNSSCHEMVNQVIKYYDLYVIVLFDSSQSAYNTMKCILFPSANYVNVWPLEQMPPTQRSRGGLIS